MGMDLGFVGTGSIDVPDEFQARFARRGEFFGLWLDVATLFRKQCNCPEDKCWYGCSDPVLSRVADGDFPVLREKMREKGLPQAFFKIVDWLERCPDVYLDYS